MVRIPRPATKKKVSVLKRTAKSRHKPGQRRYKAWYKYKVTTVIGENWEFKSWEPKVERPKVEKIKVEKGVVTPS